MKYDEKEPPQKKIIVYIYTYTIYPTLYFLIFIIIFNDALINKFSQALVIRDYFYLLCREEIKMPIITFLN